MSAVTSRGGHGVDDGAYLAWVILEERWTEVGGCGTAGDGGVVVVHEFRTMGSGHGPVLAERLGQMPGRDALDVSSRRKHGVGSA